MTAVIAVAACIVTAISAVVIGRSDDKRIAQMTDLLRYIYDEHLVYLVASPEETRSPPTLLRGMRFLGTLAVEVRGRRILMPYQIDDSGTVVALRSGASHLYLFTTTGTIVFETNRNALGMPQSAPDVHAERCQPGATDPEVFAAHRARIAKTGATPIPIRTIDELATFQTELSERTARWRATQDREALLEADLRSILGPRYARMGKRINAKLGSLIPRATLRRS